VLLALTPPPVPERAVNFANDLAEQGVEVTLVTAREKSTWTRAGSTRGCGS